MQAALSYEAIFDILMREKGREELQKLDDSFFSGVASYIQEKNALVSAGPEGSERVLQQLQNTKRMLRELYERREKKILNMALAASRTSRGFIDTGSMLNVEMMLFEDILLKLDHYRASILDTVITSKAPVLVEVKVSRQADNSGFTSASELLDTGDAGHSRGFSQVKTVRFLGNVPRFLGKDLEEYGPFEPEQVAELPSELAGVLINNGTAVEVRG